MKTVSVPCLSCGEEVRVNWKDIRTEKSRRRPLPSTRWTKTRVIVSCPKCKATINLSAFVTE